MLIKREMLMNRNCRKVLLHRGGHRVIRVAQRIHRVMTRANADVLNEMVFRYFGLCGVCLAHYPVTDLPVEQPTKFDFLISLSSSAQGTSLHTEAKSDSPSRRPENKPPEKSLTCKSTLYGQIHRLTLHSRVFRRVCLFLSHRFSLGKVGVAMQSCVARRDSFIARGL